MTGTYYYWPWDADIEAIVFVIASPIVCFFGERASAVSILALFYGVACYLVDLAAPNSPEQSDSQMGVKWTVWCLVMAFGCIVACCLLKLSVLVAGACVGGLLANIGYQMILSIGFPDYLYARLIVLGVFAIIGAIIAWKALVWVMRIATPILGGYLLIAAVDHFGHFMGWWKMQPFFPRPEPEGQFFSHPEQFPWGDYKHSIALLVVWIVLAALGILVQCFVERRRSRKQVIIHEHRALPDEGVAKKDAQMV